MVEMSAFNAAKNIIGLFALAMIVMFGYLAFYIVGQIHDTTEANMPSIPEAQPVWATIDVNLNDAMEIVRTGIAFLLVFCIGLTLFTGMMPNNSITGYIFEFGLAVIAGAVVNYLLVLIYNAMTANTSIATMANFPAFFFENFFLIIIANIFAVLVSFVFIKRQQGVAAIT